MLKSFKIFNNKKFIFLIAIINIIVGLYSLKYYFAQFSSTNPLLWIFVADCPLYTIIFAFFLLSKIYKKRHKENYYLKALAQIGILKYGLWTLSILFISNSFFTSPLIVISHSLMLFELIIFADFKIPSRELFVVFVWFIINDIMDYVFHTHPIINADFIFYAGLIAIILTIISFLIFFKARDYKCFLI